MKEFTIIKKYFSKLSKKNKGSLNLKDDIFFDYKKDNFEKDFKFVRDVGVTFQMLFNNIIRKINFFISPIE